MFYANNNSRVCNQVRVQFNNEYVDIDELCLVLQPLSLCVRNFALFFFFFKSKLHPVFVRSLWSINVNGHGLGARAHGTILHECDKFECTYVVVY